MQTNKQQKINSIPSCLPCQGNEEISKTKDCGHYGLKYRKLQIRAAFIWLAYGWVVGGVASN